MYEKMNIAFTKGSDTLEFGPRPKNRILSAEGHDSPDIIHNTIENSILHGGQIQGTRYGTRLLKYTFELFGKDQEAQRDRALDFFDPNEEMVISVTRFGRSRKIKGKVAFIDPVQPALSDPIQLTVHMLCEDPLFYETSQDVVVMSTIYPLFSLPASFPTGGVCASYRVNTNEKIVENRGGEVTGITVTVRLAVATRNVWLKNESTGDMLTVTGNMQAGDVITISSERGASGVWLNGDDFSSGIDLASVPVRLKVGSNRIVYNMDAGASLAEVSLSFLKRYRSV